MSEPVNLFTAQVQLALYERLNSFTTFQQINDANEVNRLKFACAGFNGLTGDRVGWVQQAVSSADPVSRAGLLLKAFWSFYYVTLAPCQSRLMVNPPSGLDAEAAATVQTQPYLDGVYGKRTPYPEGKFQDICVFWDEAFNPKIILDCATRGSFITLVLPSPRHNFWMGWSGFMPSFPNVFQGAAYFGWSCSTQQSDDVKIVQLKLGGA